MLAASELCRAAGRTMLPYPVVALLARDHDGRPTTLVAPGIPRADHGDLFGEWRTATLDGALGVGRPADGRLGTKLGPFVVDLTVSAGSGPPVDTVVLLTLDAWRTLGVLQQALALTVAHVTTREQFGRPLAQFQAVQFQVADARVAVDGLAELAKYTVLVGRERPRRTRGRRVGPPRRGIGGGRRCRSGRRGRGGRRRAPGGVPAPAPERAPAARPARRRPERAARPERPAAGAAAAGAAGGGSGCGGAGAAAAPPSRNTSTSCFVTRPPRPVPGIWAMSRPCSATIRATTGDMNVRMSPFASPSPAGAGAGGAGGQVGARGRPARE